MKYSLLTMVLFGAIALPGYAENNRADYDLDDDGLIEINDLNDLYEIRNHWRLSTSSVSLYGSNQGCRNMSCTGFELTKDLDFDTNQNGIFDEGDAYWNTGEGWQPFSINNITIEGNGFVIRNLTINRAASQQGLFDYISLCTIRRLGLVDVSIKSLSASGPLIGLAYSSTVEGVYTTGEMTALQGAYYVSGMVGHASSLTVRNSFSSVLVTAPYLAGALIGSTLETYLQNVLLLGKVNETTPFENPKGFGVNYGTFHNSHSAIDVAGIPSDDGYSFYGSFGALLSELKCPVGANDTNCIPGKTLYKNWPSQDNGDGIYWDFGTDQELPGLVLNGRLHRIDVTLNTSSSSSRSSSNSSSSSSSSSSKSSSSSSSSITRLSSSSSSSRSSSISSSSRTSSVSSSSRSSSISSSSPSSSSSSSASGTANSCTYVVLNEWATGFNAAIYIKNNRTTAVNGWSVNWAYTGSDRMTSFWNAKITGSNPYNAINESYNGNIAPGQTVQFGFLGTKTRGVAAQVPKVTGAICN
jgi:Cellulose binding domain